MAANPTVKWAQRKDRLFLTVDLADIEDEVVTLTAEKVVIACKSGGKDYVVDFGEFAGECDPDDEVSTRAAQLCFYPTRVPPPILLSCAAPAPPPRAVLLTSSLSACPAAGQQVGEDRPQPADADHEEGQGAGGALAVHPEG